MSSLCNQCPRRCGTDRSGGRLGFCGAPELFSVARASLHHWEEPCISGTRGSGTVFFCGCNLRCLYCQNRDISHASVNGQLLDADALAALFFRLRDEGAHNINLVTPTPYALQLVPVLQKLKPSLGIPIVYNCGGYESVETLRALDGLVDIYLPDLKYFSSELSARYSQAPDYFSVAIEAIREMLRQVGPPAFDENGLLTRGLIVRHLVLPGERADSVNLLHALAKCFAPAAFLLSLMRQYTPAFALDSPYKSLHRTLTTFEYRSVLSTAASLSLSGFSQAPDSASSAYTPDFMDPGLLEKQK